LLVMLSVALLKVCALPDAINRRGARRHVVILMLF